MNKEQYLQQHAERKETLLALLTNAQAFFAAQEKAEEAEALQERIQNIRDGVFSIVLIGEFSAGKSTFLNALMQKRILPSFSSETTATVNFLQHTSKAPNGEKGIVYYRDGHTQTVPDLSVDTLKKFVTVAGDKGEVTVAGTTERVDLFLESRFLEDGVMLVDSPGLNGTANLEEITRRQIEKSHASIFLFTAEQPGSKTEFEALCDLRTKCKRIFIVLNKIDTIKSAEDSVERVVELLRNNYMKQFPDAKVLPEIYPISAYKALTARDPGCYNETPMEADEARRAEEDSRLPAFEERLFRYLVEGEKTKETFSIEIHALQSMLNGECRELDARIDALSAERSPTELMEKRAELEEKIAEQRGQQEAQSQELQQKIQRVMRDHRDKVHNCRTVILSRVKAAIDTDDREELQDYAARLQTTLDTEYRRQSQAVDEELDEVLRDVVLETSAEVLAGLEEALSSIPGMVFKVSTPDFRIDETEIGSCIEADEALFAEKRKEMERLQAEVRQQERGRAEARRGEQRMEELRQDMREIAERRNRIHDIFDIPDVEYSKHEVRRTRPRRGLFGKLAGLLVGDKEYIDVEERVDTTRRDEALAMRGQRLAEVDKEQQELRAAMEQYRAPEKDSGLFEIEIAETKERLNELRRDYTEAMEKHQAKLEQDAGRAMKRMRRDIENYADESTEEFERALLARLKSSEQTVFEAVRGMVAGRVGEQIRRNEELLNRLIEDSQASDAERDEKLTQAQAAREIVAGLMSRSAELQTEIEEAMTDKIQEA